MIDNRPSDAMAKLLHVLHTSSRRELDTDMSLIDVFNCNGLGGYIEDYRCKKHLSDRTPCDAMASNCTSVALLLLLSFAFYERSPMVEIEDFCMQPIKMQKYQNYLATS